MLVCPKCHTTYAEPRAFCEKDGARLVPAPDSEDSSDEAPPDSSASKDELASNSTELAKLRQENERARATIADLRAKLDAAERELKTLKAAAPGRGDAPQAAKPKANKPGTGKKTPEPAPDASELQSTQHVVVPPVMHGWLIGVEGQLRGKEFGIPREGLKIGRGKRWQISIKDERVSNPHAWVGPEGPEDKDIVVRDHDSTNGTYLNDPDSNRIGEAILKQGDVIYIGDRELAAFMFVKSR